MPDEIEMVELYHWTPADNRAGIEAEGLNRDSFQAPGKTWFAGSKQGCQTNRVGEGIWCIASMPTAAAEPWRYPAEGSDLFTLPHWLTALWPLRIEDDDGTR